MDRDKLVKLLSLTTSDNSNEALSALRMANAMLSREGITWGEVLAASGDPNIRITIQRETPREKYDAYTSGSGSDWTPPHLTDKVAIERMFKTLFAGAQAGTDFHNFLTDVHVKFIKYGSLTQGQFNAINRHYLRANAQYRTR